MSEPKVRPAYWEKGHVPLTFEVMREAYLKLGLVVEEMPIAYGSSPVKVVHDGVPYTINVYHDEKRIATNAAKFYILRERHHELIKSLYEAWQPLSEKPLHVMSGGGLQLQAFFSSPKGYEGILYLSLIDDGRFQAIEAALRDAGIAHKPYRPNEEQLRGPFTLDVDEPWFSELPDIDDVKLRNQKTCEYRPQPEAAKKKRSPGR